MPCPHFDISITKRAEGQSAVAGAAYQSGERLFCKRDSRTKDYSRKQGVVYAEIMLPANAPPAYADRETLWNAVEAKEGQWNSQLARRIVAALPREIPPEQYPSLVREYCRENFVDQGMCVDFAIHDPDPPGQNPHVHIMLTMRAMDENGKWLPKAHKVYDLDEHGERIRLPSGEWKSHKENVVDWNEQSNAEKWRHSWEVFQNQYLEMNQRQERVDLRSFVRQGSDLVPTVHLGPAVSALEKKGIQTDIGNLNRDIRKVNRLIISLKKAIQNLIGWVGELRKQKQELIAELNKPDNQPLDELLLIRYNGRKLERMGWKNEETRRAADVRDDEKFHGMIDFLKDREIHSFDDLSDEMGKTQENLAELNALIREAQARMKEIETDRKNAAQYRKLRPVYEEYCKKGFKLSKEHFYSKHKKEIDTYRRVKRSLEKSFGDLSAYSEKELAEEYAELDLLVQEASDRVEQVKQDISLMKSVRYYVTELIPELLSEDSEGSEHNKPKPDIPDEAISQSNSVEKRSEKNSGQRKSVLKQLEQKKELVREREEERQPKEKTKGRTFLIHPEL